MEAREDQTPSYYQGGKGGRSHAAGEAWTKLHGTAETPAREAGRVPMSGGPDPDASRKPTGRGPVIQDVEVLVPPVSVVGPSTTGPAKRVKVEESSSPTLSRKTETKRAKRDGENESDTRTFAEVVSNLIRRSSDSDGEPRRGRRRPPTVDLYVGMRQRREVEAARMPLALSSGSEAEPKRGRGRPSRVELDKGGSGSL